MIIARVGGVDVALLKSASYATAIAKLLGRKSDEVELSDAAPGVRAWIKGTEPVVVVRGGSVVALLDGQFSENIDATIGEGFLLRRATQEDLGAW